MKEQYITIVGFYHYYGKVPFKIGKRIKCIKEPDNLYDNEAIRAVAKHIGTVGYVANSVYTVAGGTKSAGRIRSKVKKKFWVEVLFVTDSKVICRVVEGLKEKKHGEMKMDDFETVKTNVFSEDDELSFT